MRGAGGEEDGKETMDGWRARLNAFLSGTLKF